MESIVALVIFSAATLMFERAVAGAWRGINAANMNTGAVTLALRLLDETGAGSASNSETEGQTGRYEWRRMVEPVNSAIEPSAAVNDDVVTYWVEVDVAWRDGVARTPYTVRYRLLKLGRPPS